MVELTVGIYAGVCVTLFLLGMISGAGFMYSYMKSKMKS